MSSEFLIACGDTAELFESKSLWVFRRPFHCVMITSARVHDSQVVSDLLPGDEQRVYGDLAHTDQKAHNQGKAPEINADAWASLHSDTSRPFTRPESGRIAVKVINHLGDEVMKVFRV